MTVHVGLWALPPSREGAGGHTSSQRLTCPVELTLCSALPPAALMSSIYDDHKDADGFLYVTYSGENTFG